MKAYSYTYLIFIPIYDITIKYHDFKSALRRANSLLRAGYIIDMERV